MKLKIFLLLIFTFTLVLNSDEKDSAKLTENVVLLKKELQDRKYLLQLKKYHFLLMNNQRVQFILVKQGRMFSTGIGVASDEKNKGYRISIYELFDSKNYDSKELIEKYAVTDKIFLREIHDTSLYYLIEIEMSDTDSNGSVIELVHGFSAIQLKSINKTAEPISEAEAGRCNFGNCGIIHRVDWGSKK